MELPNAIEVELTSDGVDGRANVLVALDLFANRRYYFGTLVGLSDACGRARIERAAIERYFLDDQRSLPMDYRIPLIACDTEALIRVEGGKDFKKRRPPENAGLVSPDALELWRAARNELFQTIDAPILLDRTDSDGVVRLRLPLQRRSSWFR